ncbi:MAG: L-sorbose 1-phosphate reductase [Lentisphaerae bacterium RIFOXYC12_FULL_60_16]|nr:MAG: L-sorbose 1-phosphate reductase [Lentisphaerae bacterium RIFOXYC12_FULL_60_16]OGV77941.1 MAG: L-sorbose 1-phosphate reductase [Lentisphaerae bacterium RIFOXYB12_FULL_60_10]
MQTRAVRIHGENDIRLDTFELPDIRDDEILADVVTDSICMSSHKAAIQGPAHKRVPNDVAQHPTILGHEFCGTVLKVGSRWKNRFKEGQKYSIQPALSIPGRELDAPGYSFPFIGGSATHIVIPKEVMERECLLAYDGDAYFKASLAEPVSCIIGAFKSQYHFRQGVYTHQMGIRDGGSMTILAGAGPMGLGAIDYALHGPRKPKRLVVTDIDDARLNRASSLFPPESAARDGVELRYVNTSGQDAVALLKSVNGGDGYDDVFVFAPVAPLVEQGSALLGFNGCLNFFAGPSKADFKASINFYEVHYSGHHIAGSSGGNTDDMRDALELMGRNRINPAVMITHVGGMDCVVDTVMRLPSIPGGKKLVYTRIALPLTALDDFGKAGAANPLFAELDRITRAHNGLWSTEAEQYLLAHAKPIDSAT